MRFEKKQKFPQRFCPMEHEGGPTFVVPALAGPNAKIPPEGGTTSVRTGFNVDGGSCTTPSPTGITKRIAR
jgi:hypothetical protein